MFDWSGVYFKDVVKVPGPLVVLGYTSFMIMMASGPFFRRQILPKKWDAKSNANQWMCHFYRFIHRRIFPYIIPATIAFMFVGLGVSTIIPTLYSIAENTNYPNRRSTHGSLKRKFPRLFNGTTRYWAYCSSFWFAIFIRFYWHFGF